MSASELAAKLREAARFLDGEGALDGAWFGEVPRGRNKYWWRKEIGCITQAADMLSTLEGVSRALEYGTVSMTARQVIIDFDDREHAEQMFDALGAAYSPMEDTRA